jgi:hypothetical protein
MIFPLFMDCQGEEGFDLGDIGLNSEGRRLDPVFSAIRR